MKNKKLISLIGATTLAAGAVLVGATSSSAAPAGIPGFAFYANMGGSQAEVLGQTITSGLTAQSGIQGNTFPASDSNSIATTHVGNILNLGAVTTSESAKIVNGSSVVTSYGETAGVNLLAGLVKIDAVQSTVTTTFAPGTSSIATGDAHTTFVGIHVLGANIPVDVPENYTINVGGLISLKLNSVNVTHLSDGIDVMANALDLTLLKPRAGAPIGTEIILNPSNVANMNLLIPGPAVLAGIAYATKLSVAVKNVASAESGMTAESFMPRAGTEGQVVTNATAAVRVPNILQIGAVQTSEKGIASPTNAFVSESYEIGKVNVLNGLITADAIEGTVTDTKLPDGSYLPTTEAKFVNLTIAGQQIPINVSPNTVINVLGLATITINKQVAYKNAAAVYGINVTLTVAKYGLPVGAVIQVGVAIAGINLTG